MAACIFKKVTLSPAWRSCSPSTWKTGKRYKALWSNPASSRSVCRNLASASCLQPLYILSRTLAISSSLSSYLGRSHIRSCRFFCSVGQMIDFRGVGGWFYLCESGGLRVQANTDSREKPRVAFSKMSWNFTGKNWPYVSKTKKANAQRTGKSSGEKPEGGGGENKSKKSVKGNGEILKRKKVKGIFLTLFALTPLYNCSVLSSYILYSIKCWKHSCSLILPSASLIWRVN